MENVENPEQYIAAVLQKVKPQHIERTYDVKGFTTPLEFLELLARKGGRLLKGGEADVDGAAKMVLNDFLRGKLPWFTPPPLLNGAKLEDGVEGRKGALGEMGKVAMPQNSPSTMPDPDIKVDAIGDANAGTGLGTDEEVDFEGFDEKEDESMRSSEDADSDGKSLTSVDNGGFTLDAPG